MKDIHIFKITNNLKKAFKTWTLLIFLCMHSSLLNAASKESPDELDVLFIEENSQETTALDVNIFTQSPIFSPDMQTPAPTLAFLPPKSSFLTVGLNSLLPGFGHIYLGDMKTAFSLMGTTGVGMGCSSLLPSQEMSGITVFNTWLYGIYAAYRDVRIYNRQTGYSYQMPTDSFSDLSSAPFNWSVLKKPEVWGGFLAKFALAFTVVYLTHGREKIRDHSFSSKKVVQPLVALPIGIGEEAFCRGFLQSRLTESFSPWGGIILSSLIFGALHISNGRRLAPEDRENYYKFSIPYITLGGVYYGWMTYKNHSLKESVALHTWYDFTLFALGSFAGESIVTGHPKFSMGTFF